MFLFLFPLMIPTIYIHIYIYIFMETASSIIYIQCAFYDRAYKSLNKFKDIASRIQKV